MRVIADSFLLLENEFYIDLKFCSTLTCTEKFRIKNKFDFTNIVNQCK